MDPKTGILVSSLVVGYFLKQELLKTEFKKEDCEEIKQKYLGTNNLLWLLIAVIVLGSFLFFS